MQKLPEGWDHQHFNEGHLWTVVERYYLRLLRQKGYTGKEPEVQARLKKVWCDYARFKQRLFEEHAVIHFPSRVLARLLLNAYDEFEVLRDDAAPVMFKGILKGTHNGQTLESV
jgi:hypothetical protein